MSLAQDLPGRQRQINGLTDPRICSAVLADPLAVVFSDLSLKSIANIPIRFYIPEIENVLSARFHGKYVYETLIKLNRKNIELITSPGAHHYSFIAPFPKQIANSMPEIASDFSGFDRDHFHQFISGEIANFFVETLNNCK